MAARTVHSSDRPIVVRMCNRYVRVAADTVVGFMDRRTEFRSIDEQGNFLASGVCSGERFIGVTIQTIAVPDGGGTRWQECCHQ